MHMNKSMYDRGGFQRHPLASADCKQDTTMRCRSQADMLVVVDVLHPCWLIQLKSRQSGYALSCGDSVG